MSEKNDNPMNLEDMVKFNRIDKELELKLFVPTEIKEEQELSAEAYLHTKEILQGMFEITDEEFREKSLNNARFAQGFQALWNVITEYKKLEQQERLDQHHGK